MLSFLIIGSCTQPCRSVLLRWSMVSNSLHHLICCPFLVKRENMEGSRRADILRKIHMKTKESIVKKGRANTDRVNKKRKEVLFQPGDMVWVHFCKERFP